MDKNELERRLEAAEKQNIGLMDEIKYLKEQLAKVRDEQEIPDKPDFEMDEKFYYLDSMTDGVEDSCIDDIDAIDFNMFHTEEYAQEFAKKCKLIAMMLHCKWHCDRDYVPKWDDGPSFCVYFSHLFNKFMAYEVCRHEDVTVYFSTEENSQKCADWLNKHWKENGDE